MKFNDKELGAWATVFAPDKEGLLEKKGAGRGQGKWGGGGKDRYDGGLSVRPLIKIIAQATQLAGV